MLGIQYQSSLETFDMNKDQLKGSIKEGVGKAQETLGKVTGSTTQRIKGVEKEIVGKAQKKMGDAKEAVQESNRRS